MSYEFYHNIYRAYAYKKKNKPQTLALPESPPVSFRIKSSSTKRKNERDTQSQTRDHGIEIIKMMSCQSTTKTNKTKSISSPPLPRVQAPSNKGHRKRLKGAPRSTALATSCAAALPPKWRQHQNGQIIQNGHIQQRDGGNNRTGSSRQIWCGIKKPIQQTLWRNDQYRETMHNKHGPDTLIRRREGGQSHKEVHPQHTNWWRTR